MSELTAKQQAFIAEYLVDLNATQAAARAGYSPKTAREQGHRLLGTPEIAEAIAEAHGARLANARVTADRVIAELAGIAFADIGQILSWDENGSRLLPSSEIPPAVRAVIAEISEDRTVGLNGRGEDAQPVLNIRRRVKLNDKLKALDLLAKHTGVVKTAAGVSIGGENGQQIMVRFDGGPQGGGSAS